MTCTMASAALLPCFFLAWVQSGGAETSGWTQEKGVNCYTGKGATDIDTSPVGTLTVEDCEAKCNEVADCTGITIATGAATGVCYRRKDINLADCLTNTPYDTWVKGSAPGPSPPAPSPTPAPAPAPVSSVQMQVISYNLYWWCVSDEYGNCPQNANGAGFNMLYDNIKQNEPVDLIGFQECDNVAQVIGGAGLSGRFNYYAAPGDAPMAWDNQKYKQIGGPGQVWVASDQYGNRFMNWVRLQVLGSSRTIFFANTHGPLNGCGSDLGNLYINGINSNKQSADTVVLTGDFNCGSSTAAIGTLSGPLLNAATGDSYGGADHIFTNYGVQVQWEGHVNGAPSDHSLLKAVLSVTNAASDKTPFVVV